MTRARKIRPAATLAAALVLTTLLAAGCPFGVSVPGEKMEPTEANVAELAPGSLQVEVTSFNWEVYSSGTHIRVYGEAVNNSGRPLQGVTLAAVLYDKTGRPIAFGDSYVAPSYLPAGGTGTFEFVALTKRSKNIGPARLVTNSRTLSAY